MSKLPDESFDDSRARRLFPPREDGYGPYFGDYEPIVADLGRVLVQVEDDDYSGDTRVLYEKDGRYGFLNFGWGSCSGCDSLQGCDNHREVEELIRGLEADIKWFDSLRDAVNYVLNDPDRELSYYYHKAEWTDFKVRVAALVA